MVDVDDVASITIGESNKGDVRKALGSPTTTAPMNDDVWYYIGQTTERFGWRREVVKERKTLTMLFDEDGVLASLTAEDNQGREFTMNKDSTDTAGRELTILQQFFGNLGRFNSDNRDTAFDPTGGNN